MEIEEEKLDDEVVEEVHSSDPAPAQPQPVKEHLAEPDIVSASQALRKKLTEENPSPSIKVEVSKLSDEEIDE